jgi:hypothetical protein
MDTIRRAQKHVINRRARRFINHHNCIAKMPECKWWRSQVVLPAPRNPPTTVSKTAAGRVHEAGGSDLRNEASSRDPPRDPTSLPRRPTPFQVLRVLKRPASVDIRKPDHRSAAFTHEAIGGEYRAEHRNHRQAVFRRIRSPPFPILSNAPRRRELTRDAHGCVSRPMLEQSCQPSPTKQTRLLGFYSCQRPDASAGSK